MKQSYMPIVLFLVVAGCNGGGGSSDADAPSAPVTPIPSNVDPNAMLASLEVDGIDFDQIFQSTQPDYTATVGFLTASARFRAVTVDPAAVVNIEGVRLSSGAVEVALSEGQNRIPVRVTGEDGVSSSVYAVTLTRRTAASFTQNYVKASNTESGDRFADSLAIAANTLLVTAMDEDSAATGVNGDQLDNSEGSSGAAYVFTQDGAGVWSQGAYLKASNAEAGDRFGWSAVIDGDTLAVSALEEDSAASGINGDQMSNSAAGSGAVYVFTRDMAGLWSQQAYLKASNPNSQDRFGIGLALSGNTLAVGAWGEDSAARGMNGDQSDNSAADSGAVYIFTRDESGVWSQQAYLKASNAEAGDQFGVEIALSGDTLAVGANHEASIAKGVDGDQADNTAPESGAVYVFSRDAAGVWSQQAYLKASNSEADDRFGNFLALREDTLAVGANGEDSAAIGVNGNQTDNSAPSSGAVYVFTRDVNSEWSQQAYVKASNTGQSDLFGSALSLSTNALVVGAFSEDGAASGINGDQADNSASSAGAAYIFTRNGLGIWSQLAYVKAPNAEAGDQFGLPISFARSTLVIGAKSEASGATGVNGNQTDNSAINAGAAYVFQ